MTHPKDPQAELRLKIADWVDDYAETLLGSEYSGKINREECLDGLIELFQAREQQVLTELLGELPKDSVKDIEKMEHPEFYNYCDKEKHSEYDVDLACDLLLHQVVEILSSKIGELNG